MMEIGFYGNLFGQAPWKILLDLFNKSGIESNYIKFISRKKQPIKCLAAMRTPGKLCNNNPSAVRGYEKHKRSIIYSNRVS